MLRSGETHAARTRWAILFLLAAALCLPVAASDDLEIQTRLSGAAVNGRVPAGKAEFRRRADGSRRFKVEVEDLNLPAGTPLAVLVDGVKIGEMVLGSTLRAEFQLNTNDGQTVPPVVNGTTVTVSQRSGATLVAGAFATVSSAVPPAGGSDPSGETRTRAALVGSAINNFVPKGVAELRERADGLRLKVQVEDVNLPAGTFLNVLVDGKKAGEILLNSFFKGELELSSKDGQTVPAIVKGTSVVTITNGAGATILSGAFPATAAGANPIDEKEFFVRQHYVDFLERGPETGGFDDWLRVLERCQDDPSCDRVEVSSSFFRSQEFHQKGYLIYRFYKATLGRLPHYNEIITDMHAITGATGEEAERKREDFARGWLERPEVRAAIGETGDDTAFVDKLLQLEDVKLTGAVTREKLIDDLRTGQKTRGQVLRAIVEHPEVEKKEYNGAFVAMQYFGYLRRDPEREGYDAWLRVINRGDSYRVMVNGFMNSTEYRQRFGRP